VKVFLKIYDLIWYIALPFVALFLCIKGRKNNTYLKRWGERFGHYRSLEPVDIWFHAVSVGEVVASSALVESCVKAGFRVLVTTMTPTGSEQVKRMFGAKVFHQYCPYDFSFAIHQFLKDRQPKLLMVFETELWPGILSRCHQRNIPIFLANARISNRSYGRYLKTAVFWRHILSYFTKIFVQSTKDAERFISLGANASQIELAGNLKFQAIPSDLSKLEEWKKFKAYYPDKDILVFGSTHHGEEEVILEVWDKLKAHFNHLILVLVPRHPERFDKVFQLLKQKYQKGVSRISSWQPGESLDILLVDQMGVLNSLYSIARFAFVGGSLVPVGGHNVLEPLTYGVPVLTGPYTHNQQDLIRILLDEEAIIVTPTPDELYKVLKILLSYQEASQDLKQKSLNILKKHQGSLEKHMQGIQKVLSD
jgi:3-deoxy-D-manno-octulosonic-acid transferase